MKLSKLILTGLLFISLIGTSFAQGTYPGYSAFGTTSNSDRTYRSLQLGVSTIADTLGSTVDTITLIPGFVSGAGTVFTKYYTLTLKDSCALAIRDVSTSYTYSTITIIISAPTLSGGGGTVYFSGWSQAPSSIKSSQWHLTSGVTYISPTAGHYYIITFASIGTGWYEISSSQD